MAFCLFSLGLCGRSAADEPEIVDWHDAARCVGRVCGIRGRVVMVENLGSSIRLYFDTERSGARVILMHGWLVTWPSYDGLTIVATGKVGRFRDHVEVILLDPDSITVLDGAPPTITAASASPTPSAAPTPSEVAPTTTVPAPTSTVQIATPTAPPAATPTTAVESAPAAPPAPAPATPLSETEELRRRIRELEERVRELEGR